MAFEPIEDIKLEDLVKEASTELVEEKRKQATSLIKNFLLKVETLTKEVKSLKQQQDGKQKSLDKTLERIKKLKEGDWSLLSDNQGTNKPDSEKQEE